MQSLDHARPTTSCALLALLALALAAVQTAAQTPKAEVRVDPPAVEVGSFFNGAEVLVSGELPAGMKPAVLLVGGERTVELQRKGKVWGLLWMTVGTVEFRHVPELYLLATADGLAGLGPAVELARVGLGFDAVAASLGGADDRTAARELIKLKADEGLFAVAADSLRVTPAVSTGRTAISARMVLPAKVREGSYEVRLWGFADGHGTLLATSAMTVRRVGVPRLVGTLARQHGLLYGILAVVAALGAGIVTGAVFGRGSGKGH